MKLKTLFESSLKELGGDVTKLRGSGYKPNPRHNEFDRSRRPADMSVEHQSVRTFTRDFEDYTPDDLEYIFAFMGDWFKLNAPSLDNMDGKAIAQALDKIYMMIKQRSGN